MTNGKIKRIKSATLFAIIGISYTYILRTIGTFSPETFKKLTVVQITHLLSLFAGISILYFFITFHQDYVEQPQKMLKKASLLAITGSLAMLLFLGKELVFVFNVSTLPHLHRTYYFDAVTPWVSLLFILIFFIVYYSELKFDEHKQLKQATFFAIIGSAIETVLQTLVLINFFYQGGMPFFNILSKNFVIITPVKAFTFLTLLWFFSSFYREQLR